MAIAPCVQSGVISPQETCFDRACVTAAMQCLSTRVFVMRTRALEQSQWVFHLVPVPTLGHQTSLKMESKCKASRMKGFYTRLATGSVFCLSKCKSYPGLLSKLNNNDYYSSSGFVEVSCAQKTKTVSERLMINETPTRRQHSSQKNCTKLWNWGVRWKLSFMPCQEPRVIWSVCVWHFWTVGWARNEPVTQGMHDARCLLIVRLHKQCTRCLFVIPGCTI